MPLDTWQARLETHYTKLRKSEPSERPVFALEHDLTAKEFEELVQEIQSAVRKKELADSCHLPWVVYAAEVGYQYSGDEYWQTFENNTPGWTESGDRNWIRDCFLRFSDQFQGAVPSGNWARHFSIICWPITHSILPKDLQRQLARLLYDLRSTFRPEHFDSPKLLGELLAENSWNTTLRFQYFAQTPFLLGQIAAALLFQDKSQGSSLVLPSTLKRIATDLDRERGAREWFRSARTRAQRVQLAGLRRESDSTKGTRSLSGKQLEQAVSLGIEPSLLLRCREENSWDVFLKIPSFTSLQVRFPEFGPILRDSRCSVAGSALRSPLPRGYLLFGSQEVPMARWPKTGETLLSLENAPRNLEQFLRTECLLRPGPWVFRIQDDGQANEIKGKAIRSGQKYILISDSGPIDLGPYGRDVSLNCEGVFANLFEAPPFITTEITDVLLHLGLSIKRGIEVSPVGLAAAAWDNEGRAEWVFPDSPRLGIKLDHVADELLFSLQGVGVDNLQLSTRGNQSCYLLELPSLNPGAYKLKVKSVYSEEKDNEGVLEFIMREPEVSVPVSLRRTPLRVLIDPIRPTLEQLWQGEYTLEVQGPADREIRCSFEIFKSGTETVQIERSVPRLKLPLSFAKWKEAFNRHIRIDRKIQDAYDFAHQIRVSFDADELGKFTLTFEREFTPLRWILDRHQRCYHLQLVNDSGSDEKVRVSFFPFKSPDQEVSVAVAMATHGFASLKDGGIYRASLGDFSSSIVMPPVQMAGGLADLGIDPRFEHRPRTVEDLIKTIQLIEAWTQARMTGNVITHSWRETVVGAFHTELFYGICGKDWMKSERLLKHNLERHWKNLAGVATRSFPILKGIIGKLQTELPNWNDLSPHRRVTRFADFLRQERLMRSPRKWSIPPGQEKIYSDTKLKDIYWLAEFALRLASAPDTVRIWAGQQLAPGLEIFLSNRAVACAARYAVLAETRLEKTATDGSTLLRGWKWN